MSKTEPKRLRIFIQDGTGDHIVPAEPYGTFYAGSWPINNRVMYEGLEYSGYDVKVTEASAVKRETKWQQSPHAKMMRAIAIG